MTLASLEKIKQQMINETSNTSMPYRCLQATITNNIYIYADVSFLIPTLYYFLLRIIYLMRKCSLRRTDGMAPELQDNKDD